MSASRHDSWLPGGERPTTLGSYLRGIDDAIEDLLENLHGSRPERIFDVWADDTATWAKIAEIDIGPWLTTWFAPDDGWEWDPRQSGRLGRRPGRRPLRGCLGLGRRPDPHADRSVGVAWTYGGTHVEDAVFNGLPATNRPVVVRGFTIMGVREQSFRLWRYVDWIDLYTQLGLTINWRVPVEPVKT
jgi:hypothetical protein